MNTAPRIFPLYFLQSLTEFNEKKFVDKVLTIVGQKNLKIPRTLYNLIVFIYISVSRI